MFCASPKVVCGSRTLRHTSASRVIEEDCLLTWCRSSMRNGGTVSTIVSMRRVVLVAVLALVIGAAAWALWPAKKWPQAFCAPVVRVVGADADPIAISLNYPKPVLTAAQQQMVDKLRRDVRLAAAKAPTLQLRAELFHYLSQLPNNPSTNVVTDAMSHFDQQARTQLRACGVTPTGS